MEPTWTRTATSGLAVGLFQGVATKYLPNYLARHRLMSCSKASLTTFEVLRSTLGQQVINALPK